MVAYGLTRFKFKIREVLASDLLSIRMFPPVVVAIPIFVLAFMLGLINTHIILILVYSTFNIPLVALIMRSFIYEIPIEIEESAMIDGCSRVKTFLRITLPLCRDAILAVLVLSAIFSWNEFLFATILTSRETRTLPVIAAQTMTQRGIEWGPAAALTIITAGPMLIFGLIIQKYIVRGLTFGAVKG
jgi:multiple sugar transport system permease protein